MSKSKTYGSLDDELIEMKDKLDEYVRVAIRQALKHGNRDAAALLLEIEDAAFEHIDKPVGFDDAVNGCRGGPPTPDDYHFGQFEANVAVIKFTCSEISDLENGKTRPKCTEPKREPGLEEIRSEKLSDKANAERLCAVHGKYLRNVHGNWFEWNFTHWRTDERGSHLRAADVGRMVREELLTGAISDPELAKHFYRWAKQSESERGIRSTLDLAHSMPAFDGDGIEWDSDPWLFNTREITINLKTGDPQCHRREDFITRVCPTRYEPDAKAPRFEHFLREIFADDEALIHYMQWAVGYSLTGLTRHHVFFVIWGDGANGKSTLIEVLKHVIGPDYFHTMTSDDLLMSNHPRHLSPIAQLEGKRFIVASETNENRRLNNSLVKQLTGSDSIRANLMHRDAKEFRPVCKLWLTTNYKPTIRDDSKAIWRRIRLIPFTQTFEGDRVDFNLADKLKAEAEGILAWAVRGAMRVADGEPERPEAVIAAVNVYRREQDLLAQFIEENCYEGEGLKVGCTHFYHVFSSWTGGRAGTRNDVSRRMEARGIEKGKLTGGKKAWLHIDLQSNDLHSRVGK